MSAPSTKQRLWQIAAVVAAMVACWVWFAFGATYTIYAKEQLVLFVADWAAVSEYLARPAVIASIVGDYLTQFYLLIGGGATILTVVMFALWGGCRAALKRFGASGSTATMWALLPVAAEVALNSHVEYPLSMSLAAVAAEWSFVAWNKMRGGALKYVIATAWSAALYWAVGAHALMFVLLGAAWACKEQRWCWGAAIVGVGVAAVATIGRLMYLPVSQAFCYPIIEHYALQNCNVYLLTEASILVAVIVSLFAARGRAWLGAVASVAMAVVGVTTIFDRTQEYWLGMSCEAYFNRYDRVLERAERNWEHQSYVASYYTNLALAKRGELGERLTEFYQPLTYGLLLDVDEKSPYGYVIAASDATMTMGDLAEAQRAALLAMTFTPNQRSSRVAKRLVELAILLNERELAEKYLWQLERTALHKGWARSHRAILDEGSERVAQQRLNLVTEDGFVGANNWYPALYALVEANGENRIAVDYLLTMHLLRKDRQRFVADYERYFYPHWGAHPPKMYQQALMIAFDNEQELVAAIERYHISPEVQRECVEYSRIYAQERGRGEALQQRFGRTYWFYCNYAQMN